MSGAAIESVLGENRRTSVSSFVKSDEELARELHAQWNSKCRMFCTINALNCEFAENSLLTQIFYL